MILKQADLSKPESIPATLIGVHTVIDCATGRPEEPIKKVIIFGTFIYSIVEHKLAEKRLIEGISISIWSFSFSRIACRND